MKKVYQKIISSTEGDCVRAAVASILDLELEEVPSLSPDSEQMKNLIEFMNSMGYSHEGTLWNKNFLLLTNTIQGGALEWCKDTYKLKDQYCFKEMIEENVVMQECNINGLYLATVLSPMYTKVNMTEGSFAYHQVICDKDFKIVHDPNPNYEDLKRYPLSELLGFSGICYMDIFKKIEDE